MNRTFTFTLLPALVCLPLWLAPSLNANAENRSYTSQVSTARFSEAELAQVLAPIALYPDTLLTHILIAATYPLEVVEASRWQRKHSKLSPKKLMDKAEKQGWDPSVTALIAFPDVLSRMSDELDWTQDLGDAFLADEALVLDSIQQLRREADRAGNLDGGSQLVIKRQPTQIIIESPSPEVIFVPYYDPRRVYGHWRWQRYPPVYWSPFPGYVRYHNHFGWNAGVSISFNFYFSNFHWYDRHVIVHHHHHHYKRPPEPRYAISQGAQRWRHDPGHRHGVAYRTPEVRQRFNDRNPSRIERNESLRREYSNAAGGLERDNRAVSREQQGISRESRQLGVTNEREREFKNRMEHNEARLQGQQDRSGDERRQQLERDNQGWRGTEPQTRERRTFDERPAERQAMDRQTLDRRTDDTTRIRDSLKQTERQAQHEERTQNQELRTQSREFRPSNRALSSESQTEIRQTTPRPSLQERSSDQPQQRSVERIERNMDRGMDRSMDRGMDRGVERSAGPSHSRERQQER